MIKPIPMDKKFELAREAQLKFYDFACKIKPLYEALNWRWGSSSDTPGTIEIIESLNRLLLGAIEHDNCSSGGLLIEFFRSDKVVQCRVVFEAAESVTYDED